MIWNAGSALKLFVSCEPELLAPPNDPPKPVTPGASVATLAYRFSPTKGAL